MSDLNLLLASGRVVGAAKALVEILDMERNGGAPLADAVLALLKVELQEWDRLVGATGTEVRQ